MNNQIKKWIGIAFILSLLFQSVYIFWRLPDGPEVIKTQRWLGVVLLIILSAAILYCLYKIRTCVRASAKEHWKKIVDWIFWMNVVGEPILIILFIVNTIRGRFLD